MKAPQGNRKNNDFNSMSIYTGSSFGESFSIRACFQKRVFLKRTVYKHFFVQLISGGKQKMSKKTVSMRLL
jgi:hypothetical protein